MLSTASPGDIVKVHPGVFSDGHDLSGQHLTVVGVRHIVELEATHYTGDPIHLSASDVDLIFHQWGERHEP